MKNTIWSKKIPTILGVLLIFLGIVVTTFLVNQTTIFRIKAGASNVPKNVKITNITDNSFTVSYLTDESVLGSINIGAGDKMDGTALDERDQASGAPGSYKVHSITARNLSSSTKYSFSIVSGADKFLNNNAPYSVTTGGKIDAQPSDQKPLAGKIITEIGDPPEEGIVYLNVQAGQEVSILLKNDGSYILPLNSLRDESLSSYFIFPNNALLTITVFGDSVSSTATTSLSQINPVPTITLGQNYDFKENKSVSLESSPTSLPALPENKSVATSSTQNKIEVPLESQTFSDQQPEFSGIVMPNQKVEIEIHSDENIKTQVTANKSGSWNFRPEKALSSGEHTITVTTTDATGIVSKITRKFTVFAAGSQFDKSTPSGGATPIPDVSGTPTPTEAPTVSETPTPTLTPSTIASESPSPEPIPPTGPNNLIGIGGIGLSVILMGIMIFFLAGRLI